jgi:hypothetical protein
MEFSLALVSVAYNFQTGNKTIIPLKGAEYESVMFSYRQRCDEYSVCQIKLFELHFHIP